MPELSHPAARPAKAELKKMNIPRNSAAARVKIAHIDHPEYHKAGIDPSVRAAAADRRLATAARPDITACATVCYA